MTESSLYALIERIGHLMRSEQWHAGRENGLQPVHLQALDYLSRTNRYSNTAAGVTDYLGATKGTVSQTLRVLERKRLIARYADASDRRISHFELSAAGHACLDASLPPAVFETAAARLSPAQREALEAGLDGFLVALQQAHGSRSFGVCHTCRFFRREAAGFRCGLTLEPLDRQDSRRICREHEQVSG